MCFITLAEVGGRICKNAELTPAGRKGESLNNPSSPPQPDTAVFQHDTLSLIPPPPDPLHPAPSPTHSSSPSSSSSFSPLCSVGYCSHLIQFLTVSRLHYRVEKKISYNRLIRQTYPTMARARDSKTYPVFYAEFVGIDRCKLCSCCSINVCIHAPSIGPWDKFRCRRREQLREVRERVSVSAKDSKTTEGKKLTHFFSFQSSFFLSFFFKRMIACSSSLFT